MIDIREFLAKFSEVKQTDENQWEARCPSHEDNRASLHIAMGDKGIVLDCKAGCRTHDVVWAVDCKMTDLFADEPKNKSMAARVEAVYQYHDAEGNDLFQVVRLRDPKDFRQRKDAEQKKWSVKGIDLCLYHLPDVLAAESVVVVEGEKDADNLAKLGFVTTCNAGGAAAGKSKWLPAYNDTLAGKHVVIIPDLDKPDDKGERAGTRHALHVAGQLKGKAASIKIVELPIEEKQDVSDWIANGGTAEELRKIIESTPEYDGGPLGERFKHVPAKTVDDRVKEAGGEQFGADILASLGLDILGELEDGRVKLFSEYRRKIDIIRDVNRVTRADLLRICGSKALGIVFDGMGETPPGMHSIKSIREAISYTAGIHRLGNEPDSGLGIWPGKSDDGTETSSIIFVGGGEGAVLNGKPELEQIDKPRYGGRLLDWSTSSPWYDFDALKLLINQAVDPAWRQDAVQRSDALWGLWNWQKEIDHKIVTGLIMATWVQTIWRWRPQVMITGESSSGKTTLFTALAGTDHQTGIFGRLAIKSSGSTAAGLRQTIANTAMVLLCDEFDSSKHRKEVLEMLRSAGGGDAVLRGTTHHKRLQFCLRHVTWIAGIESGLERDPDRNRFISMELKKPRGTVGQLRLPAEAELNGLGFCLLASIVRTVPAAKGYIRAFRSNAPDGFHTRVVESYAVPAACYAAACGMGESEALATFLAFIDRHDDSESDSDGESLLADVLSSTVDLGKGNRRAVGELAYRINHLNTEETDALARVGISGVQEPGGDKIFFAHGLVKKYLLKGTDWEKARIDQILSRLPGAEKSRQRIAGQRPRGVTIPVESIVGLDIDGKPVVATFGKDDDLF